MSRLAPAVVLLAPAIAVLSGWGSVATGSDLESSRPITTQTATIDYAVDGDTIRVDLASGERAYVRLVGIDTPEDVRPGTPVECGSVQAARSLRALAPEGAHVTLRSDSVAAPEDRYGRLLAHAFVAGRQLEVVQLRRGWAKVYRFEGQRFDGLEKFLEAEDAARRTRRGSWAICGPDF